MASMTLRAARRIGCVFIVVGLSCAKESDVRIVVGDADTIAVIGNRHATVSARIVDAGGRSRPATGARYQWVTGSRMHITDKGQVTCDGTDEGHAIAMLGRLKTSFVVLCRPIRALEVAEVVEMTVGGVPQPLSVAVVGVDGQSIQRLWATASVGDSNVAGLRNGVLYPKSRGHTYVHVQLEGCSIEIRVDVTQRVTDASGLRPDEEFASAYQVAPDEIRYWPLPVGRYDLHLIADAGDHVPEFGIFEGTCSLYPTQTDHYYCVAHSRSRVVLRGHRQSASNRGQRGTIAIRRLPEMADAAADHGSSATRLHRHDAAAECPVLIQ